MATTKCRHAVALGRRGGNARARNLTPERLSEIGRHGAEKRWAKVWARKTTEGK